MLRHGWRTAAIVPELEHETKVVSAQQYATTLTWLQALTGLLERLQVRTCNRLHSKTPTNHCIKISTVHGCVDKHYSCHVAHEPKLHQSSREMLFGTKTQQNYTSKTVRTQHFSYIYLFISLDSFFFFKI